jgi:hypothetical protein
VPLAQGVAPCVTEAVLLAVRRELGVAPVAGEADANAEEEAERLGCAVREALGQWEGLRLSAGERDTEGEVEGVWDTVPDTLSLLLGMAEALGSVV